MEDIEKELESKSIERDEVQIKEVIQAEQQGQEEPVVKKTKKTRSAAQIAAFEKAKEKRAANIALKKKQKEEEKIIKKEKVKEFKEELTEGSLRLIKEKTEPVENLKHEKQPVRDVPQSTNPREQVIQNHYYYYGVPPPQHYTPQPEKKSRKPKKPRPPTPSSSESDSEEEFIQHQEPPEEPELYKELQNFKEPEPQTPKPQLKFRFA